MLASVALRAAEGTHYWTVKRQQSAFVELSSKKGADEQPVAVMNPRLLTTIWMVLVLGTCIGPVLSETETSQGFFASLWESIFGKKEAPARQVNDTSTDLPGNDTSDTLLVYHSGLSTTVSVDSDKNVTTSSSVAPTTTVTSLSAGNATEDSSGEEKTPSNETVSTTTKASVTDGSTTVGSNVAATSTSSSSSTEGLGTSTTVGSVLQPSFNATTEAYNTSTPFATVNGNVTTEGTTSTVSATVSIPTTTAQSKTAV